MPEDAAIEVLQRQLADAKQHHQEAKERFWDVAGKPRSLPREPTGTLEPDQEAIRRAVLEEKAAGESYLNALLRLNRFLADGVVPEDIDIDGRSSQRNAPCRRCEKLAAVCERAIKRYCNSVLHLSGAIGDDLKLALEQTEKFRLACLDAHEKLSSHWKKEFDQQKASSSSA